MTQIKGATHLQQPVEARLRDAAQMYEKQFLGEMVKAMRKASPEGGFIQSNMAEKLFKEQLDEKYVDQWTQKGGIGLSDLIYDQLMDRYGVQLGVKSPVPKPVGPLPLREQDQFRAAILRPTAGESGLTFQFRRQQNTASAPNKQQAAATDLESPWAGRLLDSYKLGTGECVVDLEHEGGLRSRVLFHGTLVDMVPGHEVGAGQKIGLLGPQTSGFLWNVNRDQRNVNEVQSSAER